MHDYTFSSFAEILGIVPLRHIADPHLHYLLTDSRKLIYPESTVFFSISSKNKNADQFLLPLYEKGVRSFVTSKPLTDHELEKFPEANILLVTDVLSALQQVTSFHRKKFNYPVVGITGSNGKTIIKEWLYNILQQKINVLRSPKSFNSQVGVPLSVWQMSDIHELAIIEAGISQPGEMELLERIIKPDVGIFTFAGDAHASGFTGFEQKINEKLTLFKNSKVLIYCADEKTLHHEIVAFKKEHPSLTLFSWGSMPGCTLQILRQGKTITETYIKCIYGKDSFDLNIPFNEEASVHNALTCTCLLLEMGYDYLKIQGVISELKPLEMRLELKQGINNCSIINDSYSSDINSLHIALDFLLQQQQHLFKTVILSDMLQTGKPSSELYKIIARSIRQKNITKFIGIGPEISLHGSYFDEINETLFFPSTNEFLEKFPLLKFDNESILLKGARLFEFERISHVFEEKKHETVLEIDLKALRHNLSFYRSLLQKNVKLMAMVKAFSYGTGSFEIANLLQHAAVEYLAVAYADEGVQLRRAGIRLPIMVMNTEEAGFENVLAYNLEPELYSFRITKAFVDFLKKRKIENYPVHIKLDTGMHRLGFEGSDAVELIGLLKQSTQLNIRSVFSHLASSDNEEHDEFTNEQAHIFKKTADTIEKAIGYDFIRHIANTSAIHRHPNLQMDMVRLGIGLYGVDANPAIQKQLQNVATLRTTISQIKTIAKGESVGYSRKGMAVKETSIATVRIGYADGYPRSLGNGKGKMLIGGKLAPVMGNVCMDMTMLDITGIAAEEGQDVIVFGEDLPVANIAHLAETIVYEMLTGISERVRRIYFE
ncbi:MAG: bifunctional UDP-N-acetylmuramoyl-tripeptide:D-alanyl-D-alanine ligase/alanine racemase [Ferruginibacter sp.]